MNVLERLFLFVPPANDTNITESYKCVGNNVLLNLSGTEKKVGTAEIEAGGICLYIAKKINKIQILLLKQSVAMPYNLKDKIDYVRFRLEVDGNWMMNWESRYISRAEIESKPPKDTFKSKGFETQISFKIADIFEPKDSLKKAFKDADIYIDWKKKNVSADTTDTIKD